MKTLYGCAGVRGPLDTYARKHGILEVEVFDKKAATKPAALRKWRKEAGPTLVFSLVAPAAVALVRPTPALDEGLTALLEAQRALQAQVILLRTPVDVTPAALPRERLAKVVARIREGLGEARDLVRIAWEPRGVWEAEAAAAFARELSIELATDPLADPREPFWHERLRYVRLGTVGGRTEFPPTRLRFLAELLVETGRASEGERAVIFATPHAPKEVKRLQQLVAQLEERAPSGGEMVIRPRGMRGMRDEEE